MLIDAPAALACPLCGLPLDPAIASLTHGLEPRHARWLMAQHPHWTAGQPVCPDCVHTAVQALNRQSSPSSLHAELDLSYPVYSLDDVGILPTPLRLHANPRYAGRGVTLAFLDSGFYPHLDLIEPHGRIKAHIDATLSEPMEKSGFRRAEATSWHGLMTTCVAAGNGQQSGFAFRGLAWQSSLVLVRTGNRRGRRIPDRDIIRALRWVLDHHAEYDIRVVNISLGGDIASNGLAQPLDDLAEEAVAEGLVVVAAAGNGGVNRIIPPASAPSVITVGGLDDQNSLDHRFHRMWRSSYGLGVDGALKPDVIAPAIWVAAPMLPHTWVHNEAVALWRLAEAPDRELLKFLKTDLAEARFKKETLRRPLSEIRAVVRARLREQKYIHPHYQHVDGTSMAAPIVTSLVAQMLEANPSLTPGKVKDILSRTAQPLRFVSQTEQGHGVVSAPLAVAAALRERGGALAGLPLSPRLTPDTVTFYCYQPGARQVSLVGGFNGWKPAAGAMWESRPDVWQIILPTPPAGAHAYKFLVDAEHWTHDVENPARTADGAGGCFSILTVA
jgi:serine protease AprX